MTQPKPMLSMLAKILAIALLAVSGNAYSKPTKITVRVMSEDAKFVGTSMGGMQIVVRDYMNKEVLAQGITKGSTGNTKLIMHTPHKRGVALSDKDTAKFTATLDLDEPRLIEITATGPKAVRQATNQSTMVQWVMPGLDITGGDGWVIKVRGLAVSILSIDGPIKWQSGKQLKVSAKVTMMCGCPIQLLGVWDLRDFEIRGVVKKNGQDAGTIDLFHTEEVSVFRGEFTVAAPGKYELIVYGYHAGNGNTGVDKMAFTVAK